MRLIPPTIADSTESDGERAVFAALADASRSALTSSSSDTSHWIVLHAFDLADHRRRLAGEIDFLCLVPGKGALVVEVKGCRSLRRQDGAWFYGNDPTPHWRGPFRQASEAMHSLRRRLAKTNPEFDGVAFWSAVCFPFLDFHETSAEWNAWQVIDHRALRGQPISRLLEGVLDHGRRELTEQRVGWFQPERGEPTTEQCEALAGLLRPDFEVFESPRSRLLRLDQEVRHYTEEQFEALEAIDLNPRIVYEGPAGTGKTMLAIEAARRAVSRGRRVLLLCFSRPLGTWLKEETAGLGRGVSARTLHEHLALLAGLEPDAVQKNSQSFWQEELPALAFEGLVDRGGGRECYDELILDEAQDILRRSYLDVLDLSLKGGLAEGRWRFFGDFTWQRVYDLGALTVEEFLEPSPETRTAGAKPVSALRYVLRVNCRNTPRVADFAVAVGGLSPGYRRIRRPDDYLDPEVIWYAGPKEQPKLLRALLTRLREDGFSGSQIVVLSTRGNEDCAAAQLTEQPWRDRLTPLVRDTEAEERQADEGDWVAACVPSDLAAVDTRQGKIKYSSIYRFKGLEAPVVVLTDVDALATPGERSLVYVGCTRALHSLIVLADRGLRGRLPI